MRTVNFLFVALAAAQFVQLSEDGPTRIDTGVNARMASRRFAAQWCNEDDLYVFGGDAGSSQGGRQRDMWKFEGDTRRWLWFPDGPGPVGRSEMASWNLYGRFWLYGGRTDAGSVLSDLWSYTLADRKWHANSVFPQGPGPLFSAVSWSDPLSNRLFICGGSSTITDPPLGNGSHVWSYDVVTEMWAEHTSAPPVPALGYGAHVTQVEDRVYVLTETGDFWLVSTETLTWTALEPVASSSPTRRKCGAFIATNTRDQLLLFGGYHGSQMYRDMWRYDPDDNVWVELNDQTRPSARFGASTCSDSVSAAYFIGGSFDDQLNNDVWRYGPKNTIHDLVQSFEFNLDSATLSAFWAAVMSTLCFLIITGFALGVCISYCRKRCKDRRLPMVAQQFTDNL